MRAILLGHESIKWMKKECSLATGWGQCFDTVVVVSHVTIQPIEHNWVQYSYRFVASPICRSVCLSVAIYFVCP